MGENKQVRVDNWGNFFLQRLQLFFSKTDFCDLTLQFQGNVQLKVHRLVLNACTEYFDLLENSDRLIDDGTILMPEMLQADVVVPIINFMYTGMLEYPMGLYHKLYQAADHMHISVLTKLLDAQRQSMGSNKADNKFKGSKTPKPMQTVASSASSPINSQTKKATPKSHLSELPATLPGRKLPVWKRKNIPYSSGSESKLRSDIQDVGKPTRFEWPEDDFDLPPMDMMDLSDFGDISYTSKPLLREDEVKPLTQIPAEVVKSNQKVKEEVREITIDDKSNQENTSRSEKRKIGTDSDVDKSPKRIRIVESEKDTTISVLSSGNSVNFDPTKIVSEILKKYPHLVKKKKNIKLKIMSKTSDKETPEEDRPPESPVKTVLQHTSTPIRKHDSSVMSKDNSNWYCKECNESTGKPLEFMLYYLYRKHMTDVHNVKFDPRICKYCGIAFSGSDALAFHLFTKHGIKPSGSQVFPSCSQCPYIAPSNQALRIHKAKHKKCEMQCSDCKLAFISHDTIAGHIQITGHMGKNKRNIYDCQYCMKTSQSSISLLSHIKSNHENEGKRDGIVSLDEIDVNEGIDLEEEDHVEEGEAEGEYILPEITSSPPSKVKIISDVKVPPSKKAKSADEIASGEAKAHSSVTSSIATSLGLLDIVVLDENQQFILQNPEGQSGETRTEYILPQIGPRNVRGDGLSSTTDELVMVLTDQDYKDGHNAISTDNSNIVVLYSHPADGQQGQFITSQGNLMVNSETGLLEIRNGATIATTSANQIVMRDSHSNHIETIEMIQREIDQSQVMKQEPFYDQTPQVSNVVEEQTEYEENVQVEESNEQTKFADVPENTENQVERITEAVNEENTAEVKSSEDQVMDDTVIEPSSSISERDSVDDLETEADKSTELDDSTQEISEPKDAGLEKSLETEVTNAEDNCVPSSEDKEEVSENITQSEKAEDEDIPHEQNISNTDDTHESPMEIEKDNENLAEKENIPEKQSEEMSIEEDEQADMTICQEESTVPEDSSQSSSDLKDAEKPYSPTDNPIDMQCEIESNADTNDKLDTDSINENENTVEIAPCDTEPDKQDNIEESHCKVEPSTPDKLDTSQCEEEPDDKQDNDENSQSSQELSQMVHTEDTQENVPDSPKISTKTSILDDWEDTSDSQHSDNKTKALKKGAVEAVHKLMDDWDEEDVEK